MSSGSCRRGHHHLHSCQYGSFTEQYIHRVCVVMFDGQCEHVSHQEQLARLAPSCPAAPRPARSTRNSTPDIKQQEDRRDTTHYDVSDSV